MSCPVLRSKCYSGSLEKREKNYNIEPEKTFIKPIKNERIKPALPITLSTP